MGCEPKLAMIVCAGVISGILLGFLFRASEAERRHTFTHPPRGALMRALASPVWTLRGALLLVVALALMALVLIAPSTFLGILPLCGRDFYYHKAGLAVGAFIGWFLRWTVWRRYVLWR